MAKPQKKASKQIPPPPKKKTEAAPTNKTVKANGKKAVIPPEKVTSAPKPKVPEPKVKYAKASYPVDSPEFYKLFPEMKTLVARLKKEGYDNFYFQMSFTPVGSKPKNGRIAIFMGLAGAK